MPLCFFSQKKLYLAWKYITLNTHSHNYSFGLLFAFVLFVTFVLLVPLPPIAAVVVLMLLLPLVDVCAPVVVCAVAPSPISNCFNKRYRPAASRIRLNSTQNASTSINKSFTLMILFRIKLCRKTQSSRTKRV